MAQHNIPPHLQQQSAQSQLQLLLQLAASQTGSDQGQLHDCNANHQPQMCNSAGYANQPVVVNQPSLQAMEAMQQQQNNPHSVPVNSANQQFPWPNHSFPGNQQLLGAIVENQMSQQGPNLPVFPSHQAFPSDQPPLPEASRSLPFSGMQEGTPNNTNWIALQRSGAYGWISGGVSNSQPGVLGAQPGLMGAQPGFNPLSPGEACGPCYSHGPQASPGLLELMCAQLGVLGAQPGLLYGWSDMSVFNNRASAGASTSSPSLLGTLPSPSLIDVHSHNILGAPNQSKIMHAPNSKLSLLGAKPSLLEARRRRTNLPRAPTNKPSLLNVPTSFLGAPASIASMDAFNNGPSLVPQFPVNRERVPQRLNSDADQRCQVDVFGIREGPALDRRRCVPELEKEFVIFIPATAKMPCTILQESADLSGSLLTLEHLQIAGTFRCIIDVAGFTVADVITTESEEAATRQASQLAIPTLHQHCWTIIEKSGKPEDNTCGPNANVLCKNCIIGASKTGDEKMRMGNGCVCLGLNPFSPTAPSTHSSGGCSGAKRLKTETGPVKIENVTSESSDFDIHDQDNDDEKRRKKPANSGSKEQTRPQPVRSDSESKGFSSIPLSTVLRQTASTSSRGSRRRGRRKGSATNPHSEQVCGNLKKTVEHSQPSQDVDFEALFPEFTSPLAKGILGDLTKIKGKLRSAEIVMQDNPVFTGSGDFAQTFKKEMVRIGTETAGQSLLIFTGFSSSQLQDIHNVCNQLGVWHKTKKCNESKSVVVLPSRMFTRTLVDLMNSIGGETDHYRTVPPCQATCKRLENANIFFSKRGK